MLIGIKANSAFSVQKRQKKISIIAPHTITMVWSVGFAKKIFTCKEKNRMTSWPTQMLIIAIKHV